MQEYNPIVCNAYETVASEYVCDDNIAKSTAYQSEADLEQNFIDMLVRQGYEYLHIHSESDLLNNLREQIQRLNNINFTDAEWQRLFHDEICKTGDGILEKTRRLQDGGTGFAGGIVGLQLDNGNSCNIRLIDKQNIHNNKLQVLNQYVATEGRHENRYDVTILCNGLPVVHVELKRRGVRLKTAYYQIDRYQRESFWSGCGLYDYVQIFVISNGTNTKYYANTIRNETVHNNQVYRGKGEGFEMTSWWTDANNMRIPDLVDFTRTFFARVTLLNILTKYCVMGTDNIMRVMRPYQIAACESIIGKVQWASDNNIIGCVDAGGYVWHTTGSGKTLTSFKCARLLSKRSDIDKVLFVVDRKDLDAQTVREYDTFEKGSADSSVSTKQLEKKLSDNNAKIIVTTIQKLGKLIKSSNKLDVYNKKVVLIFDECHRSQFGEMHESIIHKFKKYYIFGFTGTPIFAVNTNVLSGRLTNKDSDGVRHIVNKQVVLKTTAQAFGAQLHSYTIVDAINDGNVLPFRVDYLSTVGKSDNITDEKVQGIDDKKALSDLHRIEDICKYIAFQYGRKTNDGRYNSISCCDDIQAAKAYYQMMKQLQSQGEFKYKSNTGIDKDLKFAIIYSYAANGEAYDGAMNDENMDPTKLPQSDRDFLESAIDDYNHMFPGEETTFDAGANFNGYYLDVARKLKNNKLDILIVVNMMLTGFDAKTLGCLWVDKHLRAHGLIQAFSRTNRIYDSQKSYGNIVCFRSLQQEVDDAISLFGNKNACGIVTLKTYDEYYNGYRDKDDKYVKGYKSIVEDLQKVFPLDKLKQGLIEKEQRDFVSRFGTILSLRNILRSFDEFKGNEIFTEIEFQNYASCYLDIYDDITKHEANDKACVNADLVFDIQLVESVDINVDYILMLVEKYAATSCKDHEVLTKIHNTIDSTPQLRSKKALIEEFLKLINATKQNEDWYKFVSDKAVNDLNEIILDESLKHDETFAFMKSALNTNAVKSYGLAFDGILPPMSRRNGKKQAKRMAVYNKLSDWFDKYFGVISHNCLDVQSE